MSAAPPEKSSGEVAVLGCGAFVPGYGGLDAWVRSEPAEGKDEPSAELVPLRQRRRTSPLTKAFADAYAAAIDEGGLDVGSVASVFGSALGEASTMIGLLDQMWSEEGILSPMRFATSVHNAASGVVSIATENRGITTSLGADYDTPAMALLEAIGLARSLGQSVVVCCADEAPPEDLVPEGTGWGLLAVAIAIAPANGAPRGSVRLSDVEIGVPTLEPAGVPDPILRNPNVGLLDLAVSVRAGAEGVLRLDRGAGRGFVVRLGAGDR